MNLINHSVTIGIPVTHGEQSGLDVYSLMVDWVDDEGIYWGIDCYGAEMPFHKDEVIHVYNENGEIIPELQWKEL